MCMRVRTEQYRRSHNIVIVIESKSSHCKCIAQAKVSHKNLIHTKSALSNASAKQIKLKTIN